MDGGAANPGGIANRWGVAHWGGGLQIDGGVAIKWKGLQTGKVDGKAPLHGEGELQIRGCVQSWERWGRVCLLGAFAPGCVSVWESKLGGGGTQLGLLRASGYLQPSAV